MTGKPHPFSLHETTVPPMTSLYSPPPPPPPSPPFSAVFSGRLYSPPPATTSRHHLTPGKIAAVCFFSALFIFLSSFLYLIIRFISPSSSSSSSSSSTNSTTSPAAVDGGVEENQSPELRRRAVDLLPAIIFRSKRGMEQECSICLGKFLQNEELRVLPICCHAFHSVCVDLWLLSNLSCPLCRSSIHITDSEFMKRVTTVSSSSSTVRSNSIRSDDDEIEEEAVSVLSSSHKEEVAGAPAAPGPWLAAEVAEQKSWLREYFDRFTSTASSSSRSVSLLGSGRFVFTGRSEGGEDVGLEISEMFRFFSLI